MISFAEQQMLVYMSLTHKPSLLFRLCRLLLWISPGGF